MVHREQLTNHILFGSTGYEPMTIKDKVQDQFIETVGKPTNFCVGIIDIVDSTKTVARLSASQTSKYYQIFLNNMAKIVTKFNGKILKTMGDSLLFYFPDTSFSDRKFGFLSAIECGFSMMDSHEKLKTLLTQEMLPQIDYRISFDYGNVTMMRNDKWVIDLVGPTINTCAKINGLCSVNGMVIGSDLHEKTKSFKEYKYKNTGNFSIDLKHPYPVFSICRKNEN